MIVDANVILSALLGGKPSFILFEGRFHFVTTEFTIQEVKKYIPRTAKKLDVTQKALNKGLGLLPIKRHARSYYHAGIKQAQDMISRIDSKDVDVLALAITLEAYIWSQDKHFEKAGYSKLLKTHDLIA